MNVLGVFIISFLLPHILSIQKCYSRDMPEQNIERFKAKICLLGDPMVGKTSIIRKYVLDQFSDEYIPTMGTKVTKREITFIRGDIRYYISLMIWDINGNPALMKESMTDFKDFIPTSYLMGSEGVIFVCDITRKETFEHLKVWYDALSEIVGKQVFCVLLGNKVDLNDNAAITYDEIMEMNRTYGFPFYYTSARTGENVPTAFQMLAEELLNRIKKE